MNNNQFSKNAISHRELNDFLIKAKKDISSINTSDNNKIKQNQDFNDLIKKHGWLDETRLALESTGLLNISGLIDLAKIGIKSLIRGKLPPILPHRPKDMKKVTSIAERLDNQGKEEE